MLQNYTRTIKQLLDLKRGVQLFLLYPEQNKQSVSIYETKRNQFEVDAIVMDCTI